MAKIPMLCAIAVAALLAACVSQQKHDASMRKNVELEREYQQQLNQAMSAEVAHIDAAWIWHL